MAYIGNPPAERFTSFDYQDLTGGTGTSFTLTHPVGNAQEILVMVNNVVQEPGVAYTVSGTALTMTGSIASTDDFYVVYRGKAIQTATHPSDRALTATDGTFTGDASVTGDLTVDTNTLHVDAANNRVGIGTITPAATLNISEGSGYHFTAAGGNATSGMQIGNYDGSSYSPVTVRGSYTRMDVSGTERARFTSNGLTFNGDTAAANALDDYEEGTWTATFLAAGTNPTVNSAGNNVGRYVKIGNVVYFGFYSSAMNIGSAGSGSAQLGGLPYTAASGNQEYYTFTYQHGTAVVNSSSGGYIVNGQNKMQFLRPASTTGASWTTGSDLYVMVSGFYRTA